MKKIKLSKKGLDCFARAIKEIFPALQPISNNDTLFFYVKDIELKKEEVEHILNKTGKFAKLYLFS